MMGHEVTRIVGLAERMFGGGAWHGPAVLETLNGVDAELAFGHPISGAYSIWEVVLHLTATQANLLRRLNGESVSSVEGELLRPPPENPSEQEWAEILNLLRCQEAELRKSIADFPEELLDKPLTPDGSSAYKNFHGHIQHNAYHAGQIMLLKRAGRPALKASRL